ncbi:hypothetical protein [Streptomyces sp. NPDC051546]|uniref:hypothetical protein n=1 Tax=Streptomyces sp. NPDC051546 TaxID=3365655 RepID=UPI003794D43F
MPNAQLAAQIRTEILERPEHHDQGIYLDGVSYLEPEDDLSHGFRGGCGTTLGVAGFAAHLTGYTIEIMIDGPEDEVIAYKTGVDIQPVFDVAREELGLSKDDAAWLFWGHRAPVTRSSPRSANSPTAPPTSTASPSPPTHNPHSHPRTPLCCPARSPSRGGLLACPRLPTRPEGRGPAPPPVAGLARPHPTLHPDAEATAPA